MTPEVIRTGIRRSVGKTLKVSFGKYVEELSILSTDSDGFLCRARAAGSHQPGAEFWLAYKEVSSIETLSQ